MLCPTCPKRATCNSPCADLEKELARIEKPLRETLKDPRELQKISDAIAAAEFCKNNFDWEQQFETEEEQRLISRRNLLVQDSLKELTPRQKEVVELFYWDGFTYSQIAEQLGISRQTVEEHLAASYPKLRKYFTGELKTPCISALYK